MATHSDASRVPVALFDRIWENGVVLFLGAGASLEARAPVASDLEKRLAGLVGLEPTGRLEVTYDAVVASEDRAKVERLVRGIYEPLQPGPANISLARYPWRAVFTTNVDRIFEKSREKSPASPTTLNVVIEPDDFYDLHDPRTTTLVKLHGCVGKAPNPKAPLIFGQADLESVRDRKRALFRALANLGREFSLLFVGYSFADGVLSGLLAELKNELGEGWMSRSYAVLPTVAPAQKAILDRYSIRHIPATLESFAAELDSRSKQQHMQYLARQSVTPVLELGKGPLELDPETFAQVDSEMELLVRDRLELEPTRDFFRGSQAQWADIHGKSDVVRPVHDELVEALIGKEGGAARVVVVTGSGASGKTTSAMRACYDAYTKHAVPVVRLKPDRHWQARTLDLLSTKLEGRRFIILADGMPDLFSRLRDLAQHAISLSMPCSFLITLKANHWERLKQDYPPPAHVRIEMPEQLQLREARALAENLVQKGIVQTSASRTVDDIAHQIAKKCDNYLVVVLIEVVESQKIEVVVRREYETIENSLAKRAYLAASLFHQFEREIGRNHLLRFLEVFPDRWHTSIEKPHLAKLLVDRWDDTRENEYYRTRHPVIAKVLIRQLARPNSGTDVRGEFLELVSRCSGFSEYESNQLHQLARLDNVKEFLQSDEKIHQFYRTAIKAMPGNAWLYLFYAKWLEGKQDLDRAEETLEGGLDHVRGGRSRAALVRHQAFVDLLRMRGARDSPEALVYYERGRQRSDAARDLDPNHDYAYATAVELLLERARREGTTASALEHLYEARSQVAAGRNSVPDEELRNLPDVEKKTEAAIKQLENRLALDKPINGVRAPAFYLHAAGAEESNGRPKEALALLEQGLDLHPANHVLAERALELCARLEPDRSRFAVLVKLALDADANNRRFLAFAGAYECQFGKPERARSFFQRASQGLEPDFRLARPLELGWVGRPSAQQPGTVTSARGPVGRIRVAQWDLDAVYHRFDKDFRRYRDNDRVACVVRFAYVGPVAVEMRFD